MCRYPASSAARTAEDGSRRLQVPRPIIGMDTPGAICTQRRSLRSSEVHLVELRFLALELWQGRHVLVNGVVRAAMPPTKPRLTRIYAFGIRCLRASFGR